MHLPVPFISDTISLHVALVTSILLYAAMELIAGATGKWHITCEMLRNRSDVKFFIVPLSFQVSTFACRLRYIA